MVEDVTPAQMLVAGTLNLVPYIAEKETRKAFSFTRLVSSY